MFEYIKLATMIFRIIGAFFLVSSALIGIIGILISFLINTVGKVESFVGVFSWLPPLIFGIVFFSFSKLLAKWVCFDFNKFDE